MAMRPDDTQRGAPIDAAIDEAARQMTAGAPGGDLKARVARAHRRTQQLFSAARRLRGGWRRSRQQSSFVLVIAVWPIA